MQDHATAMRQKFLRRRPLWRRTLDKLCELVNPTFPVTPADWQTISEKLTLDRRRYMAQQAAKEHGCWILASGNKHQPGWRIREDA